MVTETKLVDDLENAIDCLKAAAKALRKGRRRAVPDWLLVAEGAVRHVRGQLTERDTGWRAAFEEARQRMGWGWEG